MNESKEMYLISIAHLHEAGLEGPVPVSLLAEELSVHPGSANQMVKKLAASGLVRYLPYKGVQLTSAGQRIAARTLRHRRLWETFLVDQLGLNPEEADSLACGMEHITTGPVADRLAAYLGDPHYSPGGKRIPDQEGNLDPGSTTPMNELDADHKGTIEYIEASPEIQRFLAWDGLYRGAYVTVLARRLQGSLLVECQGNQVCLSAQITPTIHLRVETGSGVTLEAAGGSRKAQTE